MEDILKKYFKTLSDSNRMGHAFLICNTKYDNLKEELNDILSDYFFNGKKNTELMNDLIIIKPENNKILKEAILALKDEMKLKSQFNKNRVYIICEAEKMNDYASNSLLKFLEEPEEDIYAFLITENVNKVLPTIKSRCQIINVGSNNFFDINSYDRDLLNKSLDFINVIEEKSDKAEAYIYDYFNKKEDKNIIKSFLEISKYFYKDCLDHKIKVNSNVFSEYSELIIRISNKNNEKQLLNKIKVILSIENMLEYNMNINLLLDKLIFELGMINHD